jgi:uncharacterized protein (TIGR03437 family)
MIWRIALKQAALLLAIAGGLHAQRIESLMPGLGGRVARDPAGNWIVAQTVSKPDFTDRNIRLRKLSDDSTAFDITIGGSGNDDLSALRILPDGDILLLGTTDSADFPATPSVLWASPAAPDGPSSFLMRLDSAGKVRTSTYISTAGLSIQARALAVGENQSLIIGAEVRGAGVARFGDATFPGEGTLLVLQVDAGLNRVSGGTRIGGGSPCNATLASVQPDGNGNIFLAGTTCGDDFPATPDAYLARRPGGTCVGAGFFGMQFPCTSGVIARLDSNFRLTAATYLGGTAGAFIRDLAVDRDGFPYVTGTAEVFPVSNGAAADGGFPTTKGAYQESVAVRSFVIRPESVFVTKLTPDLRSLVYSTFLDGSRSESPSSLLVDGAGRALIAGGTVSPDFPATGAFRNPCGPDVGLNPPQSGFVSRLTADGSGLSSSARLQTGSAQVGLLVGDRYVSGRTGDALVTVDLDSGDAPSVACVVNGGNFRTESFVAPNQLLTFIGANLPSNATVRFDGVPAPLLYSSSTQINAVVPAEVAQRAQTVVVLESGGVNSNVRGFDVRAVNPTVKVFVTSDGKLVDRGNPLADARLSDGSSNSIENPAHHGEAISLFTTGVDVGAPLAVQLGSDKADLLEAFVQPGTFGSVQVLKVRVPEPCCGGVRTIAITNEGQQTALNPGFVWVE